jgi:hypothetical protein
MYNSGNSSKNVRGSNIIDGTVEAADLATAVNSDIADGVAGKATADLALPKTGGALTGAVTTNSTFDGRDVATDGAALDVLDLAINSAANAVAITIDASENVGIGTSTPSVILEINGGTANSEVARFSNLGARYLSILAESDGTYDEAIAVFRKNSSVSQFAFRTSGAELARFTPNGLTFNGDTVAANALNDYEEGTFETTIVGITATTKTFNGTYVKIGKVVHIQGNVNISGKTGGSGNPYILIPFSPDATHLANSSTGVSPSKNTITSSIAFFGLYGSNFNMYGLSSSGNYIGNGSWTDGVIGLAFTYRTL